VTAATATSTRRRFDLGRLGSRHGWTIGVWLLLLALAFYWRTVPAQWGSFDVQSLAIDALPLCFAAMAQAVIVISGGIDLSIGSLMSVVNVLAAKYMLEDATLATTVSFRQALVIAALLVVGGALAGAFTGLLIVVTRVPDIVVTLAMLFVYAGLALAILEIPGGAVPVEFLKLGTGFTGSQWVPTGLVILAGVLVLVWLPLRWSRPGLALYAIGSNRNASYLSGVNVARTRIFAYALGGAFAALGGLALTATSGIGDPLSGQYFTLNSVAAVVLGGVALTGGIGGLVGPIAAAFVLTLVKTVLVIRGVDQNWAQVIQGSLIIVVVMLGALALRRREGRL